MDKKEILYSDFNSVENILGAVMKNPKLKQGLKNATIFKFWPKVAGKKFEKYSKANGLTQTPEGHVLTVACANAAVSSELLMFKQDILKKMNIYSKPLGVEITDINFSHKIWSSTKNTQQAAFSIEEKNLYKPDLSNFDPSKIELDPLEVEAIKNSVDNNKFATQEQRKKMFNAIILDLKTQKYIKDNNLSH